MSHLQFSVSLCLLELLSAAVCLEWQNISDPYERGALCNDFTPAGYFTRIDPANNKWIVFLEGGGGCTTPQSCNERFIFEKVRDRFTTTVNRRKIVNVTGAWRAYEDDPLLVTSRLMTSLWRFALMSARQSHLWTIDGRDLLSPNMSDNPDFFSYNHVLIPYCTSDLWLQQSTNYQLALQPDFKFTFNPTASTHQFTFRGAAVFRSVVSDLIQLANLEKASEVVFAGSSAGGVGVLNHAKWLRERLPSKCKLSTIIDSSWFIDFQNAISREVTQMNITHLVESNEIVDSCSDLDNPTRCLTARQLLTNASLYPNIPTFVIMSNYDLYILTRLLRNRRSSIDVLDLLRTVSEYGGSMALSLRTASLSFKNLSYYSTSCFQHVYLATSSLLQDGGLLASTYVAQFRANNDFR